MVSAESSQLQLVDLQLPTERSTCALTATTSLPPRPASPALATRSPPRVGYVFSDPLRRAADRLPSNVMRSTFTHSLIAAYGFPKHMIHLLPALPTKEELCRGHSDAFVDFLTTVDEREIESDTSKAECEQFGLQHDCPVFDGLATYVSLVVGGTLAGARALVDGSVDVAIHWDGGRHHATRDRAAGFCYVNDIVIGIIELQRRFKRILYLDIDVHHGDGVESAFLFSPRVYTCSFHLHDLGFYPGTGGSSSVGRGKGTHHALNVPLRRGLRSPTFMHVVKSVVSEIYACYNPDCIVLQCGADGANGNLSGGKGDERGEGWNLNPNVFADVVAFLHGLPDTIVRTQQERTVPDRCPILILGGGGYHNATTARCWAAATASAINDPRVPIPAADDDVPEHALWAEYAAARPHVGTRADENGKGGYIDTLLERTITAIQKLRVN
ncbi:hypothetical protein PhCBS80983_g04109 [Powellomyces hirtus]|uniref:Histone deacetylase 8 n=1 Tax=Powellomyces hirtus TaxID=109895 RepID=A0A507E168_9FUNG|nr:hypothetical protein PhCBS80983_g04109 [Powellomyces hirtus]